MLKLFVSSTDADSGTIPISWCISEDVLEAIKEAGVDKPVIVFCIVPAKAFMRDIYKPNNEYRTVVPLENLMTYIPFRYPGDNFIFAFITDRHNGNVYLSKQYGYGYDVDILRHIIENEDGEMEIDFWSDSIIKTKIKNENKCVLRVNVPKECFAPEPPEWEKSWVNLFHCDNCIDQCQYRKRRIFAYTIPPILILLFAIVKLLLLLFAVLILSRGLRDYWKDTFNLNVSLFVDDLFDGSYCIKRYNVGKCNTPNDFISQYWKIILMPVFWFPCLVIGIIWGLFAAAIFQAGVFSVILIVIGIMYFIHLLRYICDLPIEEFKQKEVVPEKLYEIVCDGKDKPTTLSALPPKYRTIKLKISDLKSKVCKPFAG